MSYRLQTALNVLNTEVEKGIEFPEALRRTLRAFAVSQKDLTEAYDNQ